MAEYNNITSRQIEVLLNLKDTINAVDEETKNHSEFERLVNDMEMFKHSLEDVVKKLNTLNAEPTLYEAKLK